MSAKKITIEIDPPKVFSFLTDVEKRRNAVLLDYDADRLANGDTRLNMIVVFKPINITRKDGRIRRSSVKIGSTEAEIVVRAVDGTLQRHTGDKDIKVIHTNSKNRSKKNTLSLKPSIKFEAQGVKGEAELVEASIERGTEEISEVKYEDQEKERVAQSLFDGIQWTVKVPRGEKAIHDYLIGNLKLFATFSWTGSAMGYVSVRPNDVQFFDSKKGPLGRVKSTIMEIKLWLNKVKPENLDGLKTKFKEVSA